MISSRVYVDPSLMAALKRADPKDLITFLKRDVKENSKATLERVRSLTPVASGLLKASLGITMKKKASAGEIFAIVSPKDNTVMEFAEGDRVLFTSASLKSIMKHSRFAKAAASGITKISQKTPFLYVFGIETGRKRGGRLGRRAGPARMFAMGLEREKQGFIDNIGKDLWEFIAANKTPATKPGNPEPLPTPNTDIKGKTRAGKIIEYMRRGKRIRYRARFAEYRGRRRSSSPRIRTPRPASTYRVPTG